MMTFTMIPCPMAYLVYKLIDTKCYKCASTWLLHLNGFVLVGKSVTYGMVLCMCVNVLTSAVILVFLEKKKGHTFVLLVCNSQQERYLTQWYATESGKTQCVMVMARWKWILITQTSSITVIGNYVDNRYKGRLTGWLDLRGHHTIRVLR